MMRKVSVWFSTAALTLGLCSAAMATVPAVIPYQGNLTNASGTPISGSQSIVFSLFTTLVGGAAVYTETQPTVAVANGLFSVDIGSVTTLPASIFTGGDLFLEIKVGTDAAMTPRQRLGTVAYAQRAGVGGAVANNIAGFFAATGTENLTTVTVTFAAAGYAAVFGNVEAYVTIPAATTNCYGISVSDVSATSPSSGENFQCIQNPSGVGIFHEGNSSIFRMFTVSAGAKTFYLVGDEQSGSWGIWRGRIMVLYFPDAIGPTNTSEPQPGPASAHPVGNSIQ